MNITSHHCLQLCRKSRRNFWETSSRLTNNWWTDPPIQISIRIRTHCVKLWMLFLYWSKLRFNIKEDCELEMCPTLGDTWPVVSTTLPEDSVWSIMMEVVRACWNLCLLSRVIELWNDRNHQEDHWLLITLYCPSVSKSLVCQYLESFVLYLENTEATGGLTGNVSQYLHYNCSLIGTGELTRENDSPCRQERNFQLIN